jgi:PBSX family phage portal protein
MSKKTVQKGRVLLQTTKGIFPYDVLEKAEMKSNSKQLEATQKWMTQNNLIPTPFSPISLLTLYESNSVFWRCVHQLAIDVAGLGWSLQLREDKKDNQAELDRLNEFLNHKNDDDDRLRNIFKKLLIDWGVLGYFSLEVARNRKGDVGEVFHLPAHTLKVHKSRNKYCQIRNNKKVWFKKFGLEQNISMKTGEETAVRSRKTIANELIFYKNYYPKNDYYGAPNILSAVGDVMGLIGLRDFNLAFFENYGIPSALVILEGDWEEGSDKIVKNFLNDEIKGSSNAHRSLVVTQPNNCKFNYTKLGTEVKEASFKVYEKTRQEDILIAYSMPPERIGIRVVGKLGGNVAEEATKVYIASVVEPLQLDLEEIVNELLLQSEIYQFKFNDIDTRDHDAVSKRHNEEISSGRKTPNEARNELGLKPYPEGDKFYVQSTLIETGEADDENKLSKEDEESLNA